MRARWLAVGVAGVCAYGSAVYGTLLFMKGKRASPTSSDRCASCCQSRQFDALADDYDSYVGWEEFFMGIRFLRWWQVSKAHGKVLETSAGTGRNIGFFSPQVEHVVFSDLSHNMLRQAKNKWESESVGSHRHEASFVVSNVQQLVQENDPVAETSQSWSSIATIKWIRRTESVATRSTGGSEQGSDSLELVNLSETKDIETAILAPGLQYTFPEHMFDCVVDTFGLCSCPDPVEALTQMAKSYMRDEVETINVSLYPRQEKSSSRFQVLLLLEQHVATTGH